MSTNRPDEIDGEIIGKALQTTEQLPMGAMLLKMENEQIMSMARIAPRDPEVIIGRLRKFLTAYPEAAAEAVYAKPVGKMFSMTCKDCGIVYEDQSSNANVECPVCGSTAKTNIQQRQKYAEGLSIRAAESIRSEYGYTRLTVEMDTLEGGKIRIAGTLVDYAAGNMTSDERIVSPFYKGRDGSTQRTPEDRFLNVVVKAEKAKLRRDLILDSVPGILKAMYRDECDKIAETLIPTEAVLQKIVPAFQKFGVTMAHLEQLVGRPAKMGWTAEDNKFLLQTLNGLRSGDVSVAEVLRDVTPVTPGSANDPTKAARGDAIDEIKAKRRAAENAAKSAQTAEKPAEKVEEQATTAQQDDKERLINWLAMSDSQEKLAANWDEMQESEVFKALPGNLRRSIMLAQQDLAANLAKAPSEPQDGPRLHNEPDVELDDLSGPGELPEPYSEEERRPVIDKLLAEIESAVTAKRMTAIEGKIHNDPRLSDADLNDLIDKIAAVREERGIS